jgi:hypothetical protein
MDDDDVQESGILGDDSNTQHASSTAASAGQADVPPPKPKGPLSEQEKNELTLKEAFPSVDMTVIKAVLSASRGKIEPAFHALLGKYEPPPHMQSILDFLNSMSNV